MNTAENPEAKHLSKREGKIPYILANNATREVSGARNQASFNTFVYNL